MTILDKLLYAFRRFIYRFYSDDFTQCELCYRPTHHQKTSDYYGDLTACKICCPDGYRDLEAERIAEDEGSW